MSFDGIGIDEHYYLGIFAWVMALYWILPLVPFFIPLAAQTTLYTLV